jgi:hypothetical protein
MFSIGYQKQKPKKMFSIGYPKQKKVEPLREKPKKGKYKNVFDRLSKPKKTPLESIKY